LRGRSRTAWNATRPWVRRVRFWSTSIAANITNSEDGLAGYTDDQIKTMITQGVHADGRQMLPPMPYGYLAKMTPEDLDAVLLYLRSLPGLPDAG
jgi:hypothetical protein